MIIYMNLKTTNMKPKTTNMKHIKVQSEEIIFSHEDDRYILIKKANNNVIGLNFCQSDDFVFFHADYINIDEDLTRFYQAISGFINLDNEYDLINEVIRTWVRYKNEL